MAVMSVEKVFFVLFWVDDILRHDRSFGEWMDGVEKNMIS